MHVEMHVHVVVVAAPPTSTSAEHVDRRTSCLACRSRVEQRHWPLQPCKHAFTLKFQQGPLCHRHKQARLRTGIQYPCNTTHCQAPKMLRTCSTCHTPTRSKGRPTDSRTPAGVHLAHHLGSLVFPGPAHVITSNQCLTSPLEPVPHMEHTSSCYGALTFRCLSDMC